MRRGSQNNKTIELTVRFYTNNLRRKHVWDDGYVEVRSNDFHRIPSVPTARFNTMAGVGVAIEQALANAGIVVHLPKKSRKQPQFSTTRR